MQNLVQLLLQILNIFILPLIEELILSEITVVFLFVVSHTLPWKFVIMGLQE